MSAQLHHHPSLSTRFEGINIYIPHTLVITTDVFEAFVETHFLTTLALTDHSDEYITKSFLAAPLTEEIMCQLRAYLSQVRHPLAVRSSSLLEDARFRAYAGLYKTYLLPNDSEEPACRLDQLVDAIRLVYASTYFQGHKGLFQTCGPAHRRRKNGGHHPAGIRRASRKVFLPGHFRDCAIP